MRILALQLDPKLTLSIFLVAVAVITCFVIIYIFKTQFCDNSNRAIPVCALISMICIMLIFKLHITDDIETSSKTETVVIEKVVVGKNYEITTKNGQTYIVDSDKKLVKGDKIKIYLDNDKVWKLR